MFDNTQTTSKSGSRAGVSLAIKALACLVAVAIAVAFTPTEAHAADKNDKARAAYQKAMAQSDEFQWLRDSIDGNGVTYKFMDLNKDKIDELIVDTYQNSGIFTYRNGKVIDLKATDESFANTWADYYKTKNIVSSRGAHAGRYWTVYTKIQKGKSKIVAKELGYDYDPKTEESYDDEGAVIKYRYYVEGKKVSESKYNSYVKSITKGKRKAIAGYKTLTHADISKWAKLSAVSYAADDMASVDAFDNESLKSYVGMYIYEKEEGNETLWRYDCWTVTVKKVKGDKATIRLEHQYDAASLMYPYTVYATKTFKVKNNKATFRFNTKAKSGYWKGTKKGKGEASIKFRNNKIYLKASQTSGDGDIGTDARWIKLKKK